MIETYPAFLVRGESNCYVVPLAAYEALKRPSSLEALTEICLTVEPSAQFSMTGIGVGHYAITNDTREISLLPVSALPAFQNNSLRSLVLGTLDEEVGKALVSAARTILRVYEAEINKAKDLCAQFGPTKPNSHPETSGHS